VEVFPPQVLDFGALSNMASEATRVSRYQEHLKQQAKQKEEHSEKLREQARLDRQEEIKSAPLNVDPIVSPGDGNDEPSRRAATTRRPTIQPSIQLPPSELPGSYTESLGSGSPSSSRANAPSSPQCSTGAGTFTSQSDIERSSADFSTNMQAVQRVQAELNNVKIEIEHIKCLREERDLQVTELRARLDDALARVDETEGEIEKLRSQLRDARAEERRLNDEIDVMRARERQLMDQIHTAQAPRQDEHSSQAAPSIRSGKDRNRRSSHDHRRKSSAKKELIQVRDVGAVSWRNLVL